MLFCITACKNEEPLAVDEVPETESAGINEDVDPKIVDGTIDMKDFTISANGYEFSTEEKLDSAAVYTYVKNDDYLDIRQEGFTWTEEDITFFKSLKAEEVEQSGIDGYLVNIYDNVYAYSFNLNGRAWQVLCSNGDDLNEMIKTIQLK